jgi:hypothetical protein
MNMWIELHMNSVMSLIYSNRSTIRIVSTKVPKVFRNETSFKRKYVKFISSKPIIIYESVNNQIRE